MSANIAAVRLLLDDGTDLSGKVNPRILELTLTEKRGGEADELAITLHNHDGLLVSPAPGRYLSLALGWLSGDDVPVGLVDKGRYKVDEVEESGPPDVVMIRARSADLTGDYTRRRTKTWKDTTLGAMLNAVAARNGLSAKVHPDLASKHVDAIEQHGKSDMAFVKDLGSRYDAVATWKDKRLLFMPIGSPTTASGKTIPAITLTRADGWAWRFSHAQRDEADGAEAQWHDPESGRRRTVKTGGSKRKRLKRTYASEAEAKQAAEAEAKKRQRGAWSFSYDLAVANPTLQPNGRVTLKGWADNITGKTWLTESVETSFNSGGLTQRLALESA